MEEQLDELVFESGAESVLFVRQGSLTLVVLDSLSNLNMPGLSSELGSLALLANRLLARLVLHRTHEVEEDLLPVGLDDSHVVQRVLGQKQQLVNVNLRLLLLL